MKKEGHLMIDHQPIYPGQGNRSCMRGNNVLSIGHHSGIAYICGRCYCTCTTADDRQ